MPAFFRISTTLLLCSAAAVSAQTSVGLSTADHSWQSLQYLLGLPAASTGSTPTAAAAQALGQLQSEAGAANAFYTAYPADARAGAAKKLEVMAQIQSSQIGGSRYKATALALAAAYVNDSSNGVRDRFDVALAQALSTPLMNGRSPTTNGPAYVVLADRLHAQFGDVDPVYNYYVTLTQTADPRTALRIANKIQTLNAPDWAKAEAKRVIARANLVGGPVALTLTTAAGESLDLSQPSGQPTVLYVWGGANAMGELAYLTPIASTVPSGVRWIYLALNSPSPDPAVVQNQAPIAGLQCADPVNLDGWVPRCLGVVHTPYAYVFDAAGNLTGFGPPANIPALLAAISH